MDKRSIQDAIEILHGHHNDLLRNVNGFIFLTYKPKGRAQPEHCLSWNTQVEQFVKLVQDNLCGGTRIGFDACFVPVLLKYSTVNVDYIDACECGFFSVYIDEKLNVKPCSFAPDDRYSFNLQEYSFQTIWKHQFADYRKIIADNQCSDDCRNKQHCRGKCVFFDQVTLCYHTLKTG